MATIAIAKDPYSGSTDALNLSWQDIHLHSASVSFGVVSAITDPQITTIGTAFDNISNAKLCSISKKSGQKYIISNGDPRFNATYPEVETTANLLFQSYAHCDVQVTVVVPAPLAETFKVNPTVAGEELIVDVGDALVIALVSSLTNIDAQGSPLAGGQAMLASPKYAGVTDFFFVGGIRDEAPRQKCVSR